MIEGSQLRSQLEERLHVTLLTRTSRRVARPHYDVRYFAASVLDPDGYSVEAVYKSWQHAR